MENKYEKTLVVGMPVQGTFQKCEDLEQTLNICLDVFVMQLFEGRDDGDEDYYHEYYQTIPFGRVNGKLVNGSKTKEIQCCESKSFCDAGFGKYILIINAMPEHCDLTDTVFSALPYIIANLYGILPDMIFDMTQVLGKKSA